MKERRFPVRLFLGFTSLSLSLGAQDVSLSIKTSGDRIEVSWPSALTNADQTLAFPDFGLEYSVDLRNWDRIPGRMRGLADRFVPSLSQSFDRTTGPGFYRLRVTPATDEGPMIGEGGAEVFGYQGRFTEELASLTLLPLEDFATNGASVAYLPRLTWDPTSAQWDVFSSNTLYYATYGGSFDLTNIAYNYKLDSVELNFS
jgi:hypothetical protein